MVRRELTLVGYWRSDEQPHWPDPRAFVDEFWPEVEREIVTDYLQRGFVARAYMGLSPCGMCSKTETGLSN